MLFAPGATAGIILGAVVVVWLVKGAIANAIGRGLNW
jgi:hypothetical protein